MTTGQKIPVTIRFEPQVHAEIVKVAKRESRPLNAQVNVLLKQALGITK